MLKQMSEITYQTAQQKIFHWIQKVTELYGGTWKIVEKKVDNDLYQIVTLHPEDLPLYSMEEGLPSPISKTPESPKKEYFLNQFNQKVHQYFYQKDQMKGAKKLDSIPKHWIQQSIWFEQHQDILLPMFTQPILDQNLIPSLHDLCLSLVDWEANILLFAKFEFTEEKEKEKEKEEEKPESTLPKKKIWSRFSTDEKKNHWMLFLLRLLHSTHSKDDTSNYLHWIQLPISYWEKRIFWSRELQCIVGCKDFFWDLENQCWQAEFQDPEILETRRKVKQMFK